MANSRTLIFSLHYMAPDGERIVLCRGGEVYEMESLGGLWRAVLPLKEFGRGRRYRYQLRRGGEVLRREWRGHTLPAIPSGASSVEVRDLWSDRPEDSPLWSAAFRDVILRREATAEATESRFNILLRTACADIRPGEVLGIAGDIPALGSWREAIRLASGGDCKVDGTAGKRHGREGSDSAGGCLWSAGLNLEAAAGGTFHYKYVIAEAATGRILHWEEGENRTCRIPGKGRALILQDCAPRFSRPALRCAGVAVPLFSLRSRGSFGVGEFSDIKPLAEWTAACGGHMIQLLPINDTTVTGTWTDSYPYNAVSSFALHPIYVNLAEAGVEADAEFKRLQRELNALPALDYERVFREKMRLLHTAFDKFSRGLEGDLAADADFAAFVKENAGWLLPYAVFSCLREDFGTAITSQWGKYAAYSRKKAQDYVKSNPQRVGFIYWVQYQLHLQLKEAAACAHRQGVALKGDLPIGVSPLSADVWAAPQLFNLDMQAGAPPDAFSAGGQNWGFPTYNWERMAADGFRWWRERLQKMSCYFDAYRIDHLLGFFRIWEIPSRYKSGIMGHFSPALPFSAAELKQMGFDIAQGGAVARGESDGLFVEDPRRKGFFHPRIAARLTPAYKALTPGLQEAYDALSEDFFYRRHDSLWRRSALEKLPALMRATPMLCCGEDLGMIPSCVAPVMAQLGILSLEVQRMPKDPSAEFADPARYPRCSVCTTSSHDTSPLRAWWEEDRAATGRYYSNMLKMEGEAPLHCTPQIAGRILRAHLESPSMLAIIPLQDYLATDAGLCYGGDPADERVNIPAVHNHYWRYRMHLTLEDLLADTAFCSRMRSLMRSCGRL